jgi:hypothetical protein
VTPTDHTRTDSSIVKAQIGRAAREPWRVAARCSFGYPAAIVSQPRLNDGTLFPTYAWLTCPWLTRRAAADESCGSAARWADAAAEDATLADRLRAADEALRAARAAEGNGTDECAAVGIAGQRDPLGVKCVHAHVALALVGIDDPIGLDLLERGRECPDRYCDRYSVERDGG